MHHLSGWVTGRHCSRAVPLRIVPFDTAVGQLVPAVLGDPLDGTQLLELEGTASSFVGVVASEGKVQPLKGNFLPVHSLFVEAFWLLFEDVQDQTVALEPTLGTQDPVDLVTWAIFLSTLVPFDAPPAQQSYCEFFYAC